MATHDNPTSGAVRLYDSGLSTGVSTGIENSVCNGCIPQRQVSQSSNLINNGIQTNSNDCGVYAIAFAWEGTGVYTL